VTVSVEDDILTLVNVFTVEPENQQALVDRLVHPADAIRAYPGAISATILASEDGRQVVNYAQWASRGAFDAFLNDERAMEAVAPLFEIATGFYPAQYRVAAIVRPWHPT
jgi:quinol monooxygenase YgiN